MPTGSLKHKNYFSKTKLQKKHATTLFIFHIYHKLILKARTDMGVVSYASYAAPFMVSKKPVYYWLKLTGHAHRNS